MKKDITGMRDLDYFTEVYTQLRGTAAVPRVMESSQWYPSIHGVARSLSETYGVPLHLVCGVIAILSPQTPWQDNIPATEAILDGRTRLEPDKHGVPQWRPFQASGKGLRVLTTSVARALQMLETRTVFGPDLLHYGPTQGHKTYCFYHNLLQPWDATHATIDVWMLRIAGAETVYGQRAIAYEVLELAVKRTAACYGEIPSQTQAILWELARSDLQLQPGEYMALNSQAVLVQAGVPLSRRHVTAMLKVNAGKRAHAKYMRSLRTERITA